MRASAPPLGSGFRALYVGSLVSNTGDGIRLAALPLAAAALTTSPALVAAVTAAQYLPWVSVAPVGGALVDRLDRRRLILTTQAWRGAVMVVLTLLVVADLVAIWHLCVVAFVITAGEILVDPSIVAFVPRVVDDDRLDDANSRIASVEIVTNDVAGRPVGSGLFGLVPWLPFAVDAASYLGSMVPFRRLPPARAVDARQATGAATTLRSDAAEGMRFLWRHPVLGPVTAATMVYFLGASTGLGLLVLLVVDVADGPAWSFGVILACGAVGAFVGATTGARVSRRLGVRVVLGGATVAEGVAFAAMAVTTSIGVLALVWFVVGIPAGARIPVARSLQQRLTPDRLLGRVNVSARMFTRGIIVVGAVGSGVLADAIGVRSTFVVGGLVQVVGGLLLVVALQSLSRASASGTQRGSGPAGDGR